jgi:hypothetical protein
MKLLNLLLLGFLVAIPTAAQTPSPAAPTDPVVASEPEPAPGISITRISWRKDVFIPALYEDPMTPNQEQADLLREQREVRKMNAARVKGGQEPLPVPTRELNSLHKEIPPGRSVNYIYEAKIKNTADKTITTIVWEYLLFDPETAVQLGRHQFTYAAKIRPGKTASLLGATAGPPTRLVQAHKAGKEPEAKYSERVVITRIEYDDNSFWQRPLN